MPGIFDKIKSGADKAAFEADRLRRVTQAQGALNKLKGELSAHVTTIGTRVVELRDSGSPAQPELEDLFQHLDGLRQQISDQQAEVERIRQEKAPEAPAAAPAAAGHTCPNCAVPRSKWRQPRPPALIVGRLSRPGRAFAPSAAKP
jgi:DNA repair exonuclease SbcCD ATPase subunit